MQFPRAGVALAGLCGGVFGLALARALFETLPLTFNLFNTWPGALATALLAALAGAGLLRWRAASAFAALPLALPLISLLSSEVNFVRSWTLLTGSAALFSVFLLTTENSESQQPRFHFFPSFLRFPLLLHVLLFAGLSTFYFLTLSPFVGEADTFEFQVNVAQLGVAHGNGYPLLILVGKVFELLPIGGTQAWRVNASAAVAAALAAVGVFGLARRLGAASLPAWLAAFAFGVAPSVWARAVEIEAYALNAALMTLSLYLGLHLIHDSPASRKTLYALAFVFGLSLTNHLTSALLAPALAWAVGLWLRRSFHTIRNTPYAIRSLFLSLLPSPLFFLLGLSIYLYIPLRWPALHNGEALSVEQFVYFLRGGEAAGQFNARLPLQEPQRFVYVARKIIGEFGQTGAALALLGVGSLIFGKGTERRESRERRETASIVSRSRWPAAVFLLLAYAGHAYFVLAYDPPEPDFSDFFIATYVIAAVFIALGLHALTCYASRILTAHLNLRVLPLFLLPSSFLLIPLTSIWNTLPRFDFEPAQRRLDLGRYTLSQPLAHNAALLADPKRFAAPYYLQKAEGVRPDLDIIVLPDEAGYRAALEERLAAGQVVYLARYLPGLGSGYSLRSVGPLAEVSPQPFTTPPANVQPLDVALAAGIRLVGYTLNESEDISRLMLYWHAPQTPQANLAVYLRLRSETGTLWQSAGQIPVSGLYPTNAWKPGEYVSDFYEITHQPHWAPGRYTLEAGLFPPFRPHAVEGWATVTTLEIGLPATSPRPSHLMRAQFLPTQFGEQWLLGYDRPESALPGAPVPVTLYWLRGTAEAVTAFGETRSLAAWPPGSIVPVLYSLQSPISDLDFTLWVETGHPARCGWLAAESEGCALPPIRLVGAALPPGAINFNGQLVLRRAVLETTEAERGGLVRVYLEWQALQTMQESYTVFVHLVGPDGRLYGQRDYWPVEGTRLTTSWHPGEIIRDPYEVRLVPDAPPGAYTIHVGLYLLETLQRLPVLNADSLPLDDKVVLVGLTVR
ncbi:MAG: DUF2723 domain-containing protein [Anaerolineales bacterium]|nr:DUF2723 domain-containing protein [Anaerolineales bacterium]